MYDKNSGPRIPLPDELSNNQVQRSNIGILDSIKDFFENIGLEEIIIIALIILILSSDCCDELLLIALIYLLIG